MSKRLSYLAGRLTRDPAFIAGHVTTGALVTALGCDGATAVKLRLCRWPRDAGDLGQIAARFEVDVDALTAALAGTE